MECYYCAIAKPYLSCSADHVRVIKRTVVVLRPLSWKGRPCVYLSLAEAQTGDLTMPPVRNTCACCEPYRCDCELVRRNICACGELGCTRGCSDRL